MVRATAIWRTSPSMRNPVFWLTVAKLSFFCSSTNPELASYRPSSGFTPEKFPATIILGVLLS